MLSHLSYSEAIQHSHWQSQWHTQPTHFIHVRQCHPAGTDTKKAMIRVECNIDFCSFGKDLHKNVEVYLNVMLQMIKVPVSVVFIAKQAFALAEPVAHSINTVYTCSTVPPRRRLKNIHV